MCNIHNINIHIYIYHYILYLYIYIYLYMWRFPKMGVYPPPPFLLIRAVGLGLLPPTSGLGSPGRSWLVEQRERGTTGKATEKWMRKLGWSRLLKLHIMLLIIHDACQYIHDGCHFFLEFHDGCHFFWSFMIGNDSYSNGIDDANG